MEHLVTSLPPACPPDNFLHNTLIPQATWKMDQEEEIECFVTFLLDTR